jgi:NADH-quinone oxidoreductase subunit G
MAPREQGLVSLIIDILRKGPARTPSLRDVQAADAVLVLGEDVTNTAPLLALALRQASRNRQFEIAARMRVPSWDDAAVRNAGQDARSPVFIATMHATGLDDAATRTFRADAEEIAAMGFAVAREIDPAAPAAAGLSQDMLAMTREIASALKHAQRPLIVSGTGCGSASVLQAAANIAWALCASGQTASLTYAVPECNSLGLGLIGGRTLDEAFTVMQDGLADTVIILENDLYRRAESKAIDGLLSAAKNVIVIDHLMNPTVARADIVLPAAAFAEASGALVNNEGRAQRFFQVFIPGEETQAGWKWINAIMNEKSVSAVGSRQSLDAAREAMVRELPLLAPIKDLAPSDDLRIKGQKIPRQTHRYSGRTALTANINVSEPRPPEDPDSPLAFSMEGSEEQPPSPMVSRYWAPGWNSVQALNKFQQEVGGPLRGGDPGVRLLEPTSGSAPAFFPAVTSSPDVGPGDAPSSGYCLFGSEELSMHAPAVAARSRQQPEEKG